MSEQIRDQISAFTDDELSAEECAFLVRRLERDPQTRDRVLRYSIIGRALRGELPNPDPDVLRRRIREELDGIRKFALVRGTPARSKRPVRPVVAFGIAAGVAVAVLAVLNTAYRPFDAPVPSELLAGTASEVSPVDQLGYTVPQEPANPSAVGNSMSRHPIRLTNYLISHGEYAPGIRRMSIHTNVIGNDGTTVLVTSQPVQGR